jgi:hypothetical protein
VLSVAVGGEERGNPGGRSSSSIVSSIPFDDCMRGDDGGGEDDESTRDEAGVQVEDVAGEESSLDIVCGSDDCALFGDC